MSLTCLSCSAEIQSETYKKTYVSPYSTLQYKLYHCHRCHIEFWHPLSITPEFYENEHCAAYGEFHLGVRSLPEWCTSFFKRFPLKKGRLLDIGCGDGVFLKSAERMGFEVWGIDFDKKSIEIARNKFGLSNVYAMSLEEFANYAGEKNMSFDAITFFEVLEHQMDPVSFINSLRTILKKEGYIAGSVPNRGRLFVNLDRELFSADFPPHHFLWFSKGALKNIFLQCGFSHIELYPTTLNILELSEWTESVLLGKLSKNLKNKLRALFLKPYINDERDQNKKIESFEKLYGKNKKLYFLKFLRMLRNIVFLPLALPVYPEFNRRGPQIYFQAKDRSA